MPHVLASCTVQACLDKPARLVAENASQLFGYRVMKALDTLASSQQAGVWEYNNSSDYI